MSDDTEKATCPDCDEEYSHLGIHWARSKDCDYPVPALSDEAVLDGLMFVGGSLNMRHRDANCYISTVHHDRDVLEWIADELDVLVASITEFDKTESIDYHGRRPDRPLWELRTRSLPALDKYYGWYDREDNRTVPEDVRVRPLLLKTACLLGARPMDDRPGMYLSLRRTSPPPVTVHRVFGGYGPRIIRSEDGGYVVRIQNATDLCNDLAPWPAFARDRFDADRFDEGRIVCPQCGGRFRTSTHHCEYVRDGEVVREEDASPGGSREIVEVDGMQARVRTSHEFPARYVSWTAEDCITALLDEYEAAGRVPPNPEYNDVQAGRDDLPSLSTLYARFGDRKAWLAELRQRAPAPSILAPDETPPDSILERERRLYAYYGDQLPDKEQTDLKAVVVAGVHVPEWADERGISRKVAYRNVRRGRERLREIAAADGVSWAPGMDADYPSPDPDAADDHRVFGGSSDAKAEYKTILCTTTLEIAREHVAGELTREAFAEVIGVISADDVADWLGGGDWRDALRVASVQAKAGDSHKDGDSQQGRLDYSKKEIIEAIRTVDERVGDQLLSKRIYDEHRDDDHPAGDTIMNRFRWTEIKADAGVATQPRADDLTEPAALDALREVDDRVDGPLTMDQYDNARDDDHPNSRSIAVRFGWNDSKAKAGLAVDNRGSWEREDG